MERRKKELLKPPQEARVRIEALYREFGPMVHRRCLWILKDEEAAFDALQDVFLKLMGVSMDHVASPASYIYRMATNLSLNALRSERRRRAALENLAGSLPDDEGNGVAAAVLLDILVSGLGARTRMIAYYRYSDGMGVGEIAEHMGLSISAVRKHLEKVKGRAERHKERIL
jgi:RNA polymerase sigma-70 factor, ECF subfamily